MLKWLVLINLNLLIYNDISHFTKLLNYFKILNVFLNVFLNVLNVFILLVRFCYFESFPCILYSNFKGLRNNSVYSKLNG